MKAKLRFKENGECVDCLIDTTEEGFEEMEVSSMNIEDNHKEPFLSEHKFSLIKDKTKELLSRDNYIFGLTSGWQLDAEFQQWCSDLIDFQNTFNGQTISETEIVFPTDPWGNSEELEL